MSLSSKVILIVGILFLVGYGFSFNQEGSFLDSPRLGAKMIKVEGGSFHRVLDEYADDLKFDTIIVSSFSIDQYEVTNEMFADFLNKIGTFDTTWIGLEGHKNFDLKCRIQKKGTQFIVEKGYEKHPVVFVTWYGANEYANFFNLRLPTAAEWEFAARGGNKSQDHDYSDSTMVCKFGWCQYNSLRNTHSVGEKEPNELGIHDMIGNAWEWCSDWFDKEYYNYCPSKNPQGASSGKLKSIRGGSWDYSLDGCNPSFRGGTDPFLYWRGFGFRCVGEYNSG